MKRYLKFKEKCEMKSRDENNDKKIENKTQDLKNKISFSFWNLWLKKAEKNQRT